MLFSAGKKIAKILAVMLAALFWGSFFLVLTTGILLKSGISLDRLRLGPIEGSEITILWDHKLVLEMETLSIKDQGGRPKRTRKRPVIRSAVHAVAAFDTLFSAFSVKSLTFKEIVASLDINQVKEGSYQLELKTEAVELGTELLFNGEMVSLNNVRFSSSELKTTAGGEAVLDAAREEIQATFSVTIAESLPVTIHLNADNHKISFQGESQAPVATITPIVDLFGLKPSIQHWITDALTGRSYTLSGLKGEVYWDAPEKILEELSAEVRIGDCSYTFAAGLAPVTSGHTEVAFRNGVLIITPYDASYKGLRLDAGRVEIDFNDPANIILSIRIKTREAVNQDILTLLEHYHISLPFRQTAGKTDADLLLKINLNRSKVTAKGRFNIDKGEVLYRKKHYQVNAATILLDNSDVDIEHLELTYQNTIKADVAGKLQPAEASGDLDILVRQIDVGTGRFQLQLSESEVLPRVKFRIRPEGNSLSVSPSHWTLGDMRLSLSALAFPFDDKDLSGEFPDLLVKTSTGISTSISGFFSIKDRRAELRCKGVELQIRDMVLKSPDVSVALQYDRGVTLRTLETSRWQVNGQSVALYPLFLIYADQVLNVVDSRIVYRDLIDSRMSGHYDFTSGSGVFRLENLFVKSLNIEEELGLENGLQVDIVRDETGTVFNVSQLNLVVNLSQNKAWKATLDRLELLARRAALLQPFNISSGYLKISSDSGGHPYRLTAEVQSGSHILMKDNQPVDHLRFSGRTDGRQLQITVNEDLEINVSSKKVHIDSKHLEYHLPAIINVIKELPPSTSKQLSQADAAVPESGVTPFVISLDAVDSALFIKEGSRVLADRLHLEYMGGRLTAQLRHGPGNISLDLKGKEFIAEGNDLNDQFIQALISESDFRKGRVSIAAKGTLDRFSLLVTVRDTLIKNLKTLNNIFSFLNTVPALVTFSLPKYNSEGLPVTEAVVGMDIKNGLAIFEGLWLDSPQLSMTGTGWLDLKAQKINVDLKITSQAKSNLQKIPFLGYILAGDESSSSLTLDITGDIKDPEVRNSLTRDIVRMPLDILWRTLKLPGHMAESILGY